MAEVIHIRECDDWIAVYKDGVKVEENHSLRLCEGLRALGVDYTSEWIETDDIGNALDGSDPFPEQLDADA